MKRGYPPLWLCLLILILAVVWKLLGAPLTSEQLGQLQTPLWQARVLAPSRVGRILMLWLPGQSAQQQEPTLDEDSMDDDMGQLAKYQPNEQTLLRVWLEGELLDMPLESYVCGVVAAEMPAAYHQQALQAQAVAARTRALNQQANGGCTAHAGADICGDSGCCQGYAGTTQCQAMWGAEYQMYRDRIVEAVQATKDELLTYEGEPITVLYHAMSGGMTESAQMVFAQSLPYLVSVESKGEENARGFMQDSFFSFEEVAAQLNAAVPGLNCTTDELRRTLSVGDYTQSGRARTVLVKDQAVDAKTVRKALNLRSTWFSITLDAQGVTFHQRGYGHGVGMSQVGANSMAADGSDYQSILSHYYPGTTLEKW